MSISGPADPPEPLQTSHRGLRFQGLGTVPLPVCPSWRVPAEILLKRVTVRGSGRDHVSLCLRKLSLPREGLVGASGPPPPAGKEPRALNQAPARPGRPAVKSADSRDGQLGPSPDLRDLRKTAPPARRGAPYEGSPDAEQQSPRGLGPGSVPTAASQRQALDAPGSWKEQELGLWSLCRQNRAQSHPSDQKPTDGPGARKSGLKVTFLRSQRTRRSPARSRRGA